jgi:hypothetical protein
MAYGRLGVADLTAAVNNTLYTAPTIALYSEVDVIVLNTNAADRNVKVYVTTNTSSPATTERVEDGVVVPANGGKLELNGLILSPGESIVIYPSGTNLTARVQGKEITKT